MTLLGLGKGIKKTRHGAVLKSKNGSRRKRILNNNPTGCGGSSVGEVHAGEAQALGFNLQSPHEKARQGGTHL